MNVPDPLRVVDIRKAYVEGVPVLDGVDLAVEAGRITALVGANGSGKSTLVKILSGFHHADSGSIEVRGSRVHEPTPELLREGGIRFVHQEPTVLPGISVMENLAVGGYESSAGRIRWGRERARVRALLDEWGLGLDPDADAGTLSAATIAKLAVLKAIRMRPGDEPVHAIVLDEPTASLGKEDAFELLGWLRETVERRGVGVLLISHRLDEILGFADRVLVLRSGRVVADRASDVLDERTLIEDIVGGELDNQYPVRAVPAASGTVVRVTGARGGGVAELSFKVGAGEIIGITGQPGSGFEDVPAVLMDPEAAGGGTLVVGDREIPLDRSPVFARIRAGLAYVPADRKRTALATGLSVRENMVLPRLKEFRRAGLQRLARERDETMGLIEQLRISPPSAAIAAGRLSGGNQQKVVLAKWLSARPRALLVHEPTQAVDVGAKVEIFRLIAEAAAAGLAVMIVSVEHEDLAHLCSRVLVMGKGRVEVELGGAALTGPEIAAEALRVSARPSAA